MGYLGNQSTFTGTQNNKRLSVVATAGQVDFLPSGGYSINAIDVYRNGVKLVGQQDFVALDGVTVSLITPANSNDILEFVIFENFVVSDALNSDGDQTLNGNFTVSGDLNVGGVLNATVLSTVKAGIATEAVRAGMSTEATRAGIATFATTAGIATFATTAGVSTSVSGFLGVGATGTNLNVTGVITATSFSGSGANLTGIGGTSNVNTSTLVVAGMSTMSGGLSVTGIATFSTVNITQSNPTHLRVTGFSTLASVTSNTITVSGISTFNTSSGVGTVSIGIGTTALLVDGNARIVGILTIGNTSVSIYPSTNTVVVGTSITIRGNSSQLQVGTGVTISDTHLSIAGIMTAGRLINVGTGVTISDTHLSIAGIMTVGSIGAAIGKNAIGNRTIQSAGSPSGGSDGDIYYIY